MPEMDLYLGSEIFITSDIPELLQQKKASTINNTRYVLFELPFEDKPSNLKFFYNEQEYSSIKDLEEDLSGTIDANDEKGQSRTLNNKWEWLYETGETEEEIKANDLIDTKDGTNIENYTFDVIVTGTQVQPHA